jgi:hypothetical protein
MSNIPRRKILAATYKEDLPPVDASEQKKYLRKKRQLMDPLLVAKYEKWFFAMDANDNGLVSVDELSHVFLSSGIMKRKIDIINMFKACDIDKSNELNFDEFILAIKTCAASGKLRLDKLDAIVDSANALTTETVLSQQRRNLLMHYVVTAAELRQYEVDQWAVSQQQQSNGKKRISLIDLTTVKNKKSIEVMSKTHQKHMKKAKDVVQTLCPIVRQSSKDFSENGLGRPRLMQQLSFQSIQRIDAMVAPALEELEKDRYLPTSIQSILVCDQITMHASMPCAICTISRRR